MAGQTPRGHGAGARLRRVAYRSTEDGRAALCRRVGLPEDRPCARCLEARQELRISRIARMIRRTVYPRITTPAAWSVVVGSLFVCSCGGHIETGSEGTLSR